MYRPKPTPRRWPKPTRRKPKPSGPPQPRLGRMRWLRSWWQSLQSPAATPRPAPVGLAIDCERRGSAASSSPHCQSKSLRTQKVRAGGLRPLGMGKSEAVKHSPLPLPLSIFLLFLSSLSLSPSRSNLSCALRVWQHSDESAMTRTGTPGPAQAPASSAAPFTRRGFVAVG